MVTWKTKLLGDNRFNFYRWIVQGALIIAFSLWIAINAISEAAFHSPTSSLLGAIYFVLLGQFGLALEAYCGRLGKHLDAENKSDGTSPRPAGQVTGLGR
jgi:hypothetical protein